MTLDRVVVCVLMAVVAVGAALGERRRGALIATVTATLLLTAALVERWIRSGHPPVFGTFETNLADTWALLLVGLWVRWRLGAGFSRAPLLVALGTLAHTFTLHADPTPLTISENSIWIDIHAPLAWVTWALYWHAVLLAFRGEPAQRLGVRTLGLGFLAQSAMAFSGVYYATVLFATPWSWDPVQTLSLLSWLLVALSLHFRLFNGMSLYRQRAFLVVVLGAYVASAKAVMWLPLGQSFHVFELGSMAVGAPGGPP